MLTYSELRPYLMDAIGPEKTYLFDRAVQAAESLEVDAFMAPFDHILGLSVEVGEFGIAEKMEAALDVCLDELTRLFGVDFADECPTSMKLVALTALCDIPVWEDQETIRKICMLDLSPEEILSQIVAELNACSCEEILPAFDQVDFSLIQTIGSNSGKKTEVSHDDEESAFDYSQQEAQYRAFKGICSAPSIVDRYVGSPAVLNSPFLDMAEPYFREEALKYVTVDATDSELKIHVEDLVGLACITRTGMSCLRSDLPILFSRFHLEFTLSARMIKLAEKLLAEIGDVKK